MKQLIQNLGTGKPAVATVPDPLTRPGRVTIANAASVISAGTEKMVMDLAGKSLLGKARERPDQVRRVLAKIRHEGLVSTLRAVLRKLDEPMTMGYASAGVVVACGAGVRSFKPGDRVASNGPHAGVVAVPEHLCARVPEEVRWEHAAFTVLGAIAMQGVRLSRVTLGETALVIGLGLVGQLTVSLLRAAGCRVVGTDPNEGRCELALGMGAEVARPGLGAGDVEALTRGLGADAVLIAAATKSNAPIELAAGAVRRKGRVVLVGVVGLELDRRAFYFKEAEFVVSCSYGPGRYDPEYEERGHDYPAAHVRWTEQRNMQSVLELMAAGRFDVGPLITHRFPIAQAESAYALIEKGREPYLGIVLEYPDVETAPSSRRVELRSSQRSSQAAGRVGIGVVGAGNFARMVLLPEIRKQADLHPVVLCSAGGLSALHGGEKLGFDAVTTDEAEVFADPAVDAVVVLTRHDQHARQVIEAIGAGKHVFVEKPLCLTIEELEAIDAALAEDRPDVPPEGDKWDVPPEGDKWDVPLVMVGFNRRFSPAAAQVKDFFRDVAAPLTISIRFNAGPLPAEHWTQDEAVGGGRVIGEACHAIDLATYLAGAPPIRVFAEAIGGPQAPEITDDQCFITLRHRDGSVASVAYLAGGDPAFPKERVEVVGGGRVAVIDDFRRVTLVAGGRTTTRKGSRDKGHGAEMEALARALTGGGPAPIAWEELRAVSLTAILAVRSLREGKRFEIP
ncbi:MAG: Gfo/Idh/MocA family oxidoreductase [bacterium]|nr:Gfo/Idh/MocA family oxidoreductase [bacterium]